MAVPSEEAENGAPATAGEAVVCIYNTNTRKLIVARFPVDDGVAAAARRLEATMEPLDSVTVPELAGLLTLSASPNS